MNHLMIVGNLTADPQIRTANTQNGPQPVCEFTVAVNRWAGGQQATDFYRVSAWGRLGATAQQYLRKGRETVVIGELSARAYIGNDGQPRPSLEMRAEHIKFVGGRQEGGEAQPPQTAQPPATQPTAAQPQVYQPAFTDAGNEELPF